MKTIILCIGLCLYLLPSVLTYSPVVTTSQQDDSIIASEFLANGCTGTAQRCCNENNLCAGCFSAYCEKCGGGADCCDCIETFSLVDLQNFQDKGIAVELEHGVEKATARSAMLITTAAFGLQVGDAVLQVNGAQVTEDRFKEIRATLERGERVIVKAYRTVDGSGKVLTIALKLQ